MRRLAAAALMLVGTAVPACAQRAAAHGAPGGAGGGHGAPTQPSPGGRSVPASVAPTFRGSVPGPALQVRPNFARGYPSEPGGYRGVRPMVAVPRTGGSWPEFFRRPQPRPVHPPRRPNGPWNGWGYPLGVGWIAPGYGWYGGDLEFLDDSGASIADDLADGTGDGAQVFVDPAASDGAPTQDADPSQPDEPDAYGTYPPLATQPSAALRGAREKPVTLVFKDGRPNEQVRNFMLTRTTLYVTGSNEREIPVDQLDLEATKQANRGSGVTFDLPVTH